jgi:hypothetical protein
LAHACLHGMEAIGPPLLHYHTYFRQAIFAHEWQER